MLRGLPNLIYVGERVAPAAEQEPLEPVAPAAEQEPLEPVAPAAEQELTGKELADAANDLAANIAGIVLDTMKKNDGPCKWVLKVCWKTDNRGGQRLIHDIRFLQGVWVMGKLKFSLQLNTKAVQGKSSKPVVLDLMDNAQDAGIAFIQNKESSVHDMHIYLFHVDRVDEKIPFPWTGHDLKAYVSMCENTKVPNPVPVRYE